VLLARSVWWGWPRYPCTSSATTSPTSQPATHTNVFAFVCCCFTYIYIYICSTSHTDRHRSISVCLYSLSLYIVLVLVACTLSHHHHHHHTTRAVRVYACVCVCVCIWLPFEQCFRRPDNRPHIMIIIMPRTNNRRTPPLKRTTPRPIRAVLCCVVCVYWCVLLRSCRQRWTGRNTCRPAAARLLPQEQQAGMQETGTHLPTMLLLLLL